MSYSKAPILLTRYKENYGLNENKTYSQNMTLNIINDFKSVYNNLLKMSGAKQNAFFKKLPTLSSDILLFLKINEKILYEICLKVNI